MITIKKLDDEVLQEKIGWQPFGAQKEIIKAFEEKRHIRIAAGTRFGKSMLCAYLALRELLKDDKQIWIVAPTYELTEKVFNYLVRFINKGFPSLAINVQKRPLPQITTQWGSWVKCKSAVDSTGLLGEELDLVILDEAAKMGPEIWSLYVEDRLVNRLGKSVFISTPWGQNWFYNECLKAKQKDDSAYFHFESNISPYFPKEEWQRLKEIKNEDIFNQNFRAMFLSTAASFFRNVDNVVGSDQKFLEQGKKGHLYVIGVDWAKVKDYTVITVLDRTYETGELPVFRLVYMDRFYKIPYPLQQERLKEVYKKFNQAPIWMDTTGLGEPISDSLKRDGLYIQDFQFSGKTKEALFEKLSILIDKKSILIPVLEPLTEVLVDELKSFGIEISESGRIKLGAPEGGNDDCVASLALAAWSVGEKPFPFLREGEEQVIRFDHPKY